MKSVPATLVAAAALLFSHALQGQETRPEVPCPVQDATPSPSKTTTLLEAFEQGNFHGHFRSFFMATDNTEGMSDYHAWAAGGGLHFSSSPWHGFSLGIGGAFNFNLASSDLGAKDPLTGAVNRYEIGLFDIEDPYNRHDLDRMEELWLRYQWNKGHVTFGQQALQTPFINHQDGRMRPTVESGVWLESKPWKNAQIEGGWLWGISPRSTVKWYSIGESIGLYPKGLNPDGTSSGYPENIKSKGIGLLGISKLVGKNIKIQLWDQYVENIYNTVLLQTDHVTPLKNGHQWTIGLQLTHQDALRDGGNRDASKTYFQVGSQSNVVSAQTDWQHENWQVLAAYTHITADGRFLSPREWGREPFYTFMPRERIEGSGNTHALTGRIRWQSQDKKLRVETAYGHFYLPDVKDYPYNKYAFPAFRQFNLDIQYTFGGMFKGLRAQFLYVWKGRLGEVYNNPKLIINKVDVSLYNVVLNYVY